MQKLEQTYPFTGHKGISWEAYEVLLEEALSQPFTDSVYRAIKSVFYQIPDSRLQLVHSRDQRLMEQELSGYLGFDLARTPDGSVRVTFVDSLSGAWDKGLRPGDILLGWNGIAITRQIEDSHPVWGIHPASEAFRRVLQDHFMTRGPLGTSVEVFYENASRNNRGIRLAFEPAPIRLVPDYTGIPGYHPEQEGFTTRGETGVLTLSEFSSRTYNRFVREWYPQIRLTRNLIIDLRENQGGLDEVAAGIASWLVTQEYLYEEALVRDAETGDWLEAGHLHVEPLEGSGYPGQIMVIIGPKCNGAGEGLARILEQESNVSTLGIWNTAGSFSFPGGRIRVPGRFALHYPVGMAVDENGMILLESPGDYGGGIYPDIRISPEWYVLSMLSYGSDVLMEEAISRLR